MLTGIGTIRTGHSPFNGGCCTVFLPCLLAFLLYEVKMCKQKALKKSLSINSAPILGHCLQMLDKLLPVASNLLLDDCDFSVCSPINDKFVGCTCFPCVTEVDFALHKTTYTSPGLWSTICAYSICFQGSSLIKSLYKSQSPLPFNPFEI